MNRVIIVMAIVSLFASNCKKDKKGGCIYGKIVRSTCASTVIQVLNDESIGVDNWTDQLSGTVYNNVFSVSNLCRIDGSLEVGKELYFDIASPESGDCFFCDLADYPPTVAHKVINIAYRPCK